MSLLMPMQHEKLRSHKFATNERNTGYKCLIELWLISQAQAYIVYGQSKNSIILDSINQAPVQ